MHMKPGQTIRERRGSVTLPTNTAKNSLVEKYVKFNQQAFSASEIEKCDRSGYVVLNSGGPLMKPLKIDMREGGVFVLCEWNGIHKAWFSLKSLSRLVPVTIEEFLQ